jgi:hypothetical protein
MLCSDKTLYEFIRLIAIGIGGVVVLKSQDRIEKKRNEKQRIFLEKQNNEFLLRIQQLYK